LVVEQVPILAIENLTYCYPESPVPALRNVNLQVAEGEFVVVAGASGSGKSTLARASAGLIPHFYGGSFTGRVLLAGRDTTGCCPAELAETVGMVFQDPDNQLFMTRVENELAFGLENINLPPEQIRLRLAETCFAFGLQDLLGKEVGHLSSGQKQRLALAAVCAMRPRLLVLDEPTAQLDPVRAGETIAILARLQREHGMTIVLIEKRWEHCLPYAERVLLMEGGRLALAAPPRAALRHMCGSSLALVGPFYQLFERWEGGLNGEFPLTVNEGRRLLQGRVKVPAMAPPVPAPSQAEKFVELQKFWYAYPDGTEALRDVSLTIGRGELVAVLGENAAGKSTLLRVLCGLGLPARGKVRLGDEALSGPVPGVGYLPQQVLDYLVAERVRDEIAAGEWIERFGLESFLDRHPRDLSAGERQRAALAAVLSRQAKLLLLDEPTCGLDYGYKTVLAQSLRELAAEGVTTLVVTHDLEFVAAAAERVIFLSQGRLVFDGSTQEAFAQAGMVTPQLTRLFAGFGFVVTDLTQAMAALRGDEVN
jgi:energy-coupling factor transporter ATP-binding protein EcfA2